MPRVPPKPTALSAVLLLAASLVGCAAGAPGEPVERGDLPENGDGAPIDTVGPGG